MRSPPDGSAPDRRPRVGARRTVLLCVAGAIGACWVGPAGGAVDDLDLVSRGSAGAPGDDVSRAASISADGRYVAFESFADNLSTDDDDSVLNVFVRDLATGTTTLVSRQSAADGGAAADGPSADPAISADGRHIVFESNAGNLAAAAVAPTDVYVRDLQAQTTTLVSRQSAADGGAGADATAFSPVISADGRYVAFDTFATNLSTEDGTSRDVFVRDTQAQTTTLASRQSAADGGAAGDANSFSGSISANGRIIAFQSGADNLSSEDVAPSDIFVRDLDAATTTLVSRASGAAGAAADASSDSATISGTGRVIAFISSADNLSAEDDDAVDDVFVRDLDASTTTLVSRADGAAGAAADDGPFDAAISGDGRFVVFSSDATNLSGDDVDPVIDAFVRDLSAATTRLVSRAAGAAGAGGDATSEEPTVSADGRYVAFESQASNLSTEDDDAAGDVFRRDVLGPPPPPPPGPAPGPTTAPGVCKTLAPAPAPSPGDPRDITLTTGQLLINQRIDQAAIRRANGVQGWIDAGIEGRDLCQGTLGAAELAAGIVSDLGGPVIAFSPPDPRPIRVAAAKPADKSRITLTTGQLLINQRISQAAIRRMNALKARLDTGLTGGDVDDRSLAQPVFVSGLRVLAAPPPASPPAPSTTRVAPARPGDPGQVTLSTGQLLINQRISQAAVRRANALIRRIEDGVLASDVRDGTITALDLAPGVAP